MPVPPCNTRGTSSRRPSASSRAQIQRRATLQFDVFVAHTDGEQVDAGFRDKPRGAVGSTRAACSSISRLVEIRFHRDLPAVRQRGEARFTRRV